MTGAGGAGPVRKARRGDVDGLAGMLGRAFDDDPLACFVFPDPIRRRRGLPRFFGLQLRHVFLPGQEVYTTEDGTSAALWSPPGRRAAGLVALARLAPVVPLLGRRLRPTLAMLSLVEARHPKEPHWYLGVLGTEPERQGRGLGSSVLEPVLTRCDAEGVPAYLESSKEANVAFYRRHGFEVTEELSVTARGPRLWLMWRQPRLSQD